MNLSDEEPKPEESSPSDETSSSEVIFPDNPLPEDFTPLGGTSRLPRARRRRANRMLVPPSAGERAVILDGLARRAFPSFEFFLFALFSGIILGAAYLLDSPAVLLVGILLAPLLTPWVGMVLAVETGSWRFFFETLSALVLACALVFLAGALAGLAGHLWLPLRLFYADFHSHLWWPDLVVVALGAALLTVSFVRTEQKPILQSIMLAYGLFLPLNASGVGLGIGVQPLWPNGLLVFLTHLALAILVGGLTLAALRFKPIKVSGYFLPFLIGLLSLVALASLTGLTRVIRDGIIATRRSAPTPTTLILPSLTPSVTSTPIGTGTTSPSPTLVPSSTPTVFFTPVPTPSYAIINADPQYGGAYVRSEPATGAVIATLANGSIVQVLPETQSVNGVLWAHIRLETIGEGWVLQGVLNATTITTSPTSTLIPTVTP